MKIYVSEEDKVDNRFQFGGLEYRCSELDIEVQSLEQHEEEIRKPLEDTVERLLQEIKDLECLVKLKEQAKQEVIAELEEWVDKDENHYIYNFEGWTKRKELKQKLSDMKGGN